MTATLVQPDLAPPSGSATAAGSVRVILRQLAELLRGLSDDQYRCKPVGVVQSSIGGHVRHCLDHVDTLLNGAECGAINYDVRRRGTDVECCRRAALDVIRRQESELMELAMLPPDLSLRLTVLMTPAAAVEVPTSLGRELAFVLSHTIHHNSLVGVMAALLGVGVPDRFGYAPATIAHQEATQCSR